MARALLKKPLARQRAIANASCQHRAGWSSSPYPGRYTRPIHAMKKIEAIIKPFKLDEVKEALHEVGRSEEHTSELPSLMRTSYAVFCLKKKTHISHQYT